MMMQKQRLALMLGTIIMLGGIGQVQAADFSAQALEQAAVAYNKSNGALVAMQQLERQDNGFVALMLARCFSKGVVGCPEDTHKAQIYTRQQGQIEQQLQRLATQNHAEAYNWLGNIKRDSGTSTDRQQAVRYFQKSASLNNPYAMSVLGQMYDTTLDGFLHDDSQAFIWYQKAANLGDTAAMMNTGVMYAKGRGVTKDERKAVEWYQKAANLGDADAMNRLANMYRNGQGVVQNDTKAVELYQKAANLGDVSAIYNLGWMYEKGRGVAKDERKAVEWYQKAADLGDADAMDNLGFMYENGQGVAKNEYKAAELYRKAADLDNAWAMYHLGQMYYFGRGGLKGGMPASLEWYQKAADLGNSNAAGNLGFMYAYGWGVPVDYSKAIKLYNKAIELDAKNAYAYWRLGVMYDDGLGVAWDDKKAFELYQKAVDLGNTDAITTLAARYMDGRGIPQNVQKGIELYQKAIDLNNKGAMTSLARRYLYGNGVEKDNVKAVKLLQRAISLNDSDAYFLMADMYREGLGVPKNTEKAIQIYQQLAKSLYYDSPRAMLELGKMYRDGEGVAQDTQKAMEYFKQPTRFSDYRGILAIGYMYESGKGVKQDYNRAAEYYLVALKGDTYKRSSAKTYLADVLRDNKITNPDILRQVQAYFNPAPTLSWLKQPNSTTEQETIDFSVTLKDTGYGIGDVRLLVDGIPVDQKVRDFGSIIKGSEQHDFSVNLPKGRHIIRIEANNAENLGIPAVLEIQVESEIQETHKPKIYAVIVGIDQFQNSKATLKYAVADAQAMYTQLKKQVGSLYDEGNIQLLTTQAQTSKQSIQQALNQVKKQAKMNDVFVFYVASHGTTFDDVYYMFSSDLLQTSSERMKQASFSTEELQTLFAQIQTSKKIVFMDTCHSGGGIDASKLMLGSRDIMEDQQMIERMRQRSGATVLMASGSEQKAQEGYKGHGVFTYTVLQALSGQGDQNKDGFVDSGELISYVDDYVPKITKEIFNKTQVPSVSMSGQSVAFKVSP